MSIKGEIRNWVNKSREIIFLLCLMYSLLNGWLVVLCFLNAYILGWRFMILIGCIFLANLLGLAAILKKRQRQAVRALFGDDEEGYAEFRERCRMFPRKKVKEFKKENTDNRWT